jgi:8-oxo-dGTP diphosphatase
MQTKPLNHYVAGFAFSPDRQLVLLVRKAKPKWQAGKLNGIGGSIEDFYETARGAMQREFREETGIETNPDQWKSYATLSGPPAWKVEFFFTELVEKQASQVPKVIEPPDVGTLPPEGEPVFWAAISDLHEFLRRAAIIENLPWLIHLALDCLEDGRPLRTEVTYPL